VNRESLKAKRLVGRTDLPVKILGNGEVAAALTVVVDGISASAKGKIEAAGGTVTIPTPKQHRPRGVRREAQA
jgi:large subunit ribosomal protein L15